MRFKRVIALWLVLAAVLTSAGTAAAAGSQPDWQAYDALMAEIGTTVDFAGRAILMHQAEEMLMATGAVMPLSYLMNSYLAKPDFTGYYTDLRQTTYFMAASNGSKNTARVLISRFPTNLDPAFTDSYFSERTMIANSFGGLYMYNAAGVAVPNFATDSRMSEDGLTYTFTLREGLKWSDGSPLNAKDFEYSWKRATAKVNSFSRTQLFECIKGYPDAMEVTAADDGTQLSVNLNKPTAYFMDLVTMSPFYAVKQAAVESGEGYQYNSGFVVNPSAWATVPGFICSGAFMLQQWKADDTMVFVKNPYYWDADHVKLESLEVVSYHHDKDPYSSYKKGSLDFIDYIPLKNLPQLLKAKKPEIHFTEALETDYAVFSVKSPLFDGKTQEQAVAMRRGISMLIDRQKIVIDRQKIAGDTSRAANTLIPPGLLDGNGQVFKASSAGYVYPVEDGYFPLKPDIDQARELLTSAGFEFGKNGKLTKNTPLAFTCIYGTYAKQTAELLRKDFARIGISLTIKEKAFQTSFDSLKPGNNDFVLFGIGSKINDPIEWLTEWTSDHSNFAHFGQ